VGRGRSRHALNTHCMVRWKTWGHRTLDSRPPLHRPNLEVCPAQVEIWVRFARCKQTAHRRGIAVQTRVDQRFAEYCAGSIKPGSAHGRGARCQIIFEPCR
jgi:hypothetical protein